MKPTIYVANNDGDDRNHIDLIASRLQQHYNRLKQANPLGYLDQIEQQFDKLCADIAAELGGKIEHHNGNTWFNFSSVPNLEHYVPTTH